VAVRAAAMLCAAVLASESKRDRKRKRKREREIIITYVANI
jgi:hypothetical protein